MTNSLPVYRAHNAALVPLPTWMEISDTWDEYNSPAKAVTLLCEDGPLVVTLPNQFGCLPCSREELVRLLVTSMQVELAKIELEKP